MRLIAPPGHPFETNRAKVLTPDLVGPSLTRNSGIIGEGVDLNLEHLG